MKDIREGAVKANGNRFAFLEVGEGPLVLLLHGFPDNAWTWSHQLPVLAGAGYRAVAPFMRGYPPTEIPSDGRYDMLALGKDVTELVRALGGGPAYIVGHDWGAIATYAAIGMSPSSILAAAVIGVTHPNRFRAPLGSPAQIHHAFHFWFFQMPGMAEAAVAANDLAFVDYLWQYWSPRLRDAAHIARVKRDTLGIPGAVEAALGYYRALARAAYDKPIPQEMLGSFRVPTLSIWGADDPVRVTAEGEEVSFAGPYRRETVERSAHFVHREQPDAVNRLVLDWFASIREPSRAPVADAAS